MKAGTLRSAWRHRRWRRYVLALAASTVGDFLYSVGLVVYLIEETGSAGWVAAAVICRMATFTLLGPLGGVVADRFDRRRLMVVLDTARVAAMAAAGLVVAAGGPPGLVIGLVVVVSALTTPYRPAAVAATPLLVGEDDLAAANAAEASVSQLAWFVGPALGALIVAISGASAALFVNAASFAISAVLIAGVGDIGGGRARDARADHTIDDGVVRQLFDGAQALRRVPGLAALTLMVAGVLFAFGIEQVVQVVVVRERLGLEAGAVGVLNACAGIGGLVAVPVAGRLAARRDAGRLLAASGVMLGVPLALLAVTTSSVVAGALMVVEGVGNITLEVLFVTMLQRACPEPLLGRVYALQDSSGALAQLAGTVAAPLLITGASLEVALVVGGGSLVLLSVLLLPALMAVSDRTEAERERLAPMVAELTRLGIFGEAPQAAKERIARHATVLTVEGGSVVFSEGDAPADLYVIRAGTVSVSAVAEGEIRRLGPGEWFGEIGLLRQIPRTATVTVVEAAELLVIPGTVFIEAISAQERFPEQLAAVLTARLGQTHPHLVDPAR